MRVFGWQTLMRNESEGSLVATEVGTLGGHKRPEGTIDRSFACKRSE
jgi:hypothetical protein